MIHATCREMVNAHRQHLEAVQDLTQDTLRCMAYSYAIECGIKAVLMRQNRWKSTEDVRADYKLGPSGHDLRQGLRLLRAGREVMDKLIDTKTTHKSPQNVVPEHYHQASRYGVRVADWHKLEKNLREVMDWVGRQMESG